MKNDRVIPKLRQDIVFKVLEENNKKQILLWDKSQIANPPLVFPQEIVSLLIAFDGKTTFGQLRETISETYNGNPEAIDEFFNSLEQLINDLDYLLYLDTPRFEKIRNDIISYLNSKIRQSCCSGSSYPSNVTELTNFIFNMLQSADFPKLNQKINGIIVPHIDYRIGYPAHHIYANVYQNIIEQNYDLFVILGTSHYGNSDYFMLTKKNFETPFGIVEIEVELIEELTHNYAYNLTFDDLAHRYEHSVEYPIIWIQHLLKKPNAKILPIAVGSFHDFIYYHKLPIEDERISTFYSSLRNVVFKKYKNPLFIASVDFSHVGRKFEDKFDAIDIIEDIKHHDFKLIENLKNGDHQSFFKELTLTQDKFRVCGISPIYSIFEILKPKKTHFLGYDFWDDRLNQSIVSFASFALEI